MWNKPLWPAVLLLGCSGCAVVQPAPPLAPPPAQFDARAAAKQIVDANLEAGGFDRQMQAVRSRLLMKTALGSPRLIRRYDALSAAYDKILSRDTARRFAVEQLLNDYSAAELYFFLDFYRSPVGKKFTAQAADLGRRSTALVYRQLLEKMKNGGRATAKQVGAMQTLLAAVGGDGPQQLATVADDPAQRQAAGRLVGLLRAQTEQAIDAIFSAVKAARSGSTPAVSARARRVINNTLHSRAYRDGVTALLAARFDTSELNRLADFFAHPAARKVTAAYPALLSRLLRQTRPAVLAYQREVKRLRREVADQPPVTAGEQQRFCDRLAGETTRHCLTSLRRYSALSKLLRLSGQTPSARSL